MVREGYKQTEVGVIPEDWTVTSLGEIGQSLIGLTYRPENTCDYGTLVLRSSNIQNDRLDYENNVYVDSSLPLPSRVIVKEGDILICVRNGSKQLIGKCALIDAGAAGSAFGAFMSVFRTKLFNFVFYQFQSDVIQKQINEIMGATINQITTKDLVAFQIPLPPSQEEQRSIAQALSDVDALISALDKTIAKKRAIKTATMQQLLTGKKRLPGFGEGKGYKESAIGIIPEDWKTCMVGETVSFSGGSQPPRSTFIFKPRDGYIRLIQIRDYKTDAYATYIPTELAKKTCTLDDVMIGRYGPPIFQILRGIEGAYNVALMKAIPSEKIDKEFLYHFIKNDELFKLMEMLSQRSSGQTGVELPALRQYPLALPSIKEQRAIATALSDMDAEIAALETRLAKTQSIKQGMMQELLTGRTRLV